jgi:hypothetical protein
MREIRSRFESAGEGASGVGNLWASSVRCVPRGTRVGRFFDPCTVGNCLIPLRFGHETGGFESRPPRHQYLSFSVVLDPQIGCTHRFLFGVVGSARSM